MKEELEERLVSKVMGWDTKRSKREHRRLRTLAAYGYDEYMRFGPGMRFVEKMALWLSQFKGTEERQAAYDFVVDRVLFVTRAQMEQVVSMTYPDFIVPTLVRQVADESGGRLPFWRVGRISRSAEFRMLLAKCLFAGMSDGSHMDIFRRGSPEIDHEQVVRTHEMSRGRARSLAEALQGRLSRLNAADRDRQCKFRNVFLIDDFSASGKSFLRPPGDGDGGADGKVARFYESISEAGSEMSRLVDLDDLRMHVVLYVATDRALRQIKDSARSLLPGVPIEAHTIYTIPSGIKLDEKRDRDFYRLVATPGYGEPDPPDRHMRVGRSEKPYLGFDQCALPLVMHHNTPNNSLPILHASGERFEGLFPRIRRHT